MKKILIALVNLLCVTGSSLWVDWLCQNADTLSVVFLGQERYSDTAAQYTEQLVESLLHRGDISLRVSNSPLSSRSEGRQAHLLIARDILYIWRYLNSAATGLHYSEIIEDFEFQVAANSHDNIVVLLLKEHTWWSKEFKLYYRMLLKYFWEKGNSLRVVIIEKCFGDCQNNSGEIFYTFNPFVVVNRYWKGELEARRMNVILNISKIFDDRFRNLNGYTLRIISSLNEHRELFAYGKINGFPGPDLMTLDIIMEEMNATFIYSYFKSGNVSRIEASVRAHAVMLKTSTTAVLAIRNIPLPQYTHQFEILPPILLMNIPIIVSNARFHSPMTLIFRCFPLNVWVTLLLAYLASSVVWKFLGKFNPAFNTDSWWNSFSDMIQIFSSAGWTRLNHVKSNAQRIMLTFCLLCSSVVVVNVFLGIMFRLVINPTRYDQIDTLEQLDKSGLDIYAQGYGFQRDIDSPLFERLRYKVKPINYRSTFHTLKDVSINQDKAYVLTININEIQQSYPDLFEQIHIMDEPAWEATTVRYLLKKASPYEQRFKQVISICIESGIWDAQQDKYSRSAKVFNRLQRNVSFSYEENNGSLKVLSLSDLFVAFFILAIGLSVCVIVFLTELLLGKVHN